MCGQLLLYPGLKINPVSWEHRRPSIGCVRPDWVKLEPQHTADSFHPFFALLIVVAVLL